MKTPTIAEQKKVMQGLITTLTASYQEPHRGKPVNQVLLYNIACLESTLALLNQRPAKPKKKGAASA